MLVSSWNKNVSKVQVGHDDELVNKFESKNPKLVCGYEIVRFSYPTANNRFHHVLTIFQLQNSFIRISHNIIQVAIYPQTKYFWYALVLICTTMSGVWFLLAFSPFTFSLLRIYTLPPRQILVRFSLHPICRFDSSHL